MKDDNSTYKKYIDEFRSAVEAVETHSESVFFSKTKDTDTAIKLDSALLNLEGLTLILREAIFKILICDDKQNPWVWYYYSTFLRYSTENKKKAFSCAMKSVELTEQSKEYIGAISRNFITLAINFEKFDLIDKEIYRLSKNTNSQSQILLGVAEDLSNSSHMSSLNDVSKDIIAGYINEA